MTETNPKVKRGRYEGLKFDEASSRGEPADKLDTKAEHGKSMQELQHERTRHQATLEKNKVLKEKLQFARAKNKDLVEKVQVARDENKALRVQIQSLTSKNFLRKRHYKQ